MIYENLKDITVNCAADTANSASATQYEIPNSGYYTIGIARDEKSQKLQKGQKEFCSLKMEP